MVLSNIPDNSVIGTLGYFERALKRSVFSA
uniref:Uncharacterized protein n=1 Tax=Lepeophtheirus salmonis TaxID=72036 RepID=A0A0K2T1G4_LEPSM